MNYYSFHIGDYVTATVHLDALEDLAYRRLLDMYYDTENPIPLETQRVSRRLRMDSETVDSVLKEFFTQTENGWVNSRCDADIAAYHHKADANKINGKLGGRPKKTQSVNFANPTVTQNNLNQEPRTKNQEPITKEEKQRERRPTPAKPIDQPSDVDSQTWADFLALRTKKRAPVTATVLTGAREEAAKAGMTLEAFLKIWCRRGSQGMEASWLKPDEVRPGGSQGFNRQEALEARNRAVVARMVEKENQNALG